MLRKICPTYEGTGRVVGDDGFGFRPSKSDFEEADDCADCEGTGSSLISNPENQAATSSQLSRPQST